MMQLSKLYDKHSIVTKRHNDERQYWTIIKQPKCWSCIMQPPAFFDQIFEHMWFTHDTNVTRMENKIQDAPPLPLELRFGATPLPAESQLGSNESNSFPTGTPLEKLTWQWNILIILEDVHMYLLTKKPMIFQPCPQRSKHLRCCICCIRWQANHPYLWHFCPMGEGWMI